VSLIDTLCALPGVEAAGEYSYRGDRFVHVGRLPDELARKASIMCRATSMGVRMEADLLDGFCAEDCGLMPTRGWIVRGPEYSVCVLSNVFCFVRNDAGTVNEVVRTMREALDPAADII